MNIIIIATKDEAKQVKKMPNSKIIITGMGEFNVIKTISKSQIKTKYLISVIAVPIFRRWERCIKLLFPQVKLNLTLLNIKKLNFAKTVQNVIPQTTL